MTEVIRTLDKFSFSRTYCQLNFACYHVIEPHIKQNIISSKVEPVLYTNYFHFLWFFVVNPLNVLKYLRDFSLLRGELAPH